MTTRDPELMAGFCDAINGFIAEKTEQKCHIDFLPKDGFGICVRMALSPDTETTFIGGSKGRQVATFSVVVQDVPVSVRSLIDLLEDVKDGFEGLDTLTTGERIVSVSTTTPSKVGFFDNGTVRYVITVTIDYYN